MYENDQEQMQFLKDYIIQFSDLIPKILIQTKSDLIKSENEKMLLMTSFA